MVRMTNGAATTRLDSVVVTRRRAATWRVGDECWAGETADKGRTVELGLMS